MQIFLDAFTPDGFFNAQRATEAKAVSYLQLLLAQDSVAFCAFDAGKVAYPYYPIGFVFGSPLASDPLLSQTSIPEAYDIKRCGYIAELAVDRGHRRRHVGHRLIAAYVAYCTEHLPLNVLVRTNEADAHLYWFYCANGFTKLDITARQYLDIPEGEFVTKRYFCYALR